MKLWARHDVTEGEIPPRLAWFEFGLIKGKPPGDYFFLRIPWPVWKRGRFKSPLGDPNRLRKYWPCIIHRKLKDQEVYWGIYWELQTWL